MSAYVVDDHVLDYILTFFATPNSSYYLPSAGTRIDARTVTELTAIGQTLLNENYRSVNRRYRWHRPAHVYSFRRHRLAMTGHRNTIALQVLSACACLDYQSCETNDWRQTDAHAILEQIKDRAINALAGYDAAKWGAPEHPAARSAAAPLLLV